jgi:hypothetical protein
MVRLLGIQLFVTLSLLLAAHPARAQSLEELELRKRTEQQSVGFGFLGIIETAAGLNRDRPEVSSLLLLAPQLKIGDRMRLRLNLGFVWTYLQRQPNPTDLTDFSLQFAHLGLYREPWSQVLFSGYARWYFPTSKASRNASLYGQLRLVGRASRAFGPLYLALELNGQKYFHRHTTWATDETPGSADWLRSAGREDYLENNTSFGLGQTFTASLSPLRGLDLSLIWSFYQSRHYPADGGHADGYGSSYLERPRQTGWSHSYRFVADATYGLGALPWPEGARWRRALCRIFLSLGYYSLAPQLQEGGRRIDPFDPRYARLYFDLMVIH